MGLTALVASSFTEPTPPSSAWVWFLLCGGGLLAFVLLVAGIGELANRRNFSRYRSTGPWADVDEEDHSRLAGVSHRPWEDTYRRKGVTAASEAELAEAEVGHAARSAEVAARPGGFGVSRAGAIGGPGSADKDDEHRN